MRPLLIAAFAAVLLAACQSAPPPMPEGKTVTVGDWTVRTGGYVSADAGVVND